MRPGPGYAVTKLELYVKVNSEPRPARDVLLEIITKEKWFFGDEAADKSDQWVKNFISKIKSFLNDGFNLGSFQTFELNRSNPEYIQGSCFCLPNDPEHVVLAKSRRANTLKIYSHIRENSETYLEKVCIKFLTLLGVVEPHYTPRSGDGGVDFYGMSPIGFILKPEILPAGSEKHMNVWFVGQAKHYNDTVISTKEIREIVGSTELARAKIFAGNADPQRHFLARLCDPIFSVFVTTGRFSKDSVDLMRKAGIIPMDGPQLGQFLADHGIGLVDNVFCQVAFDTWVAN